MTDIVVHEPDTFSKVLELVEKFQNAHDVAWYRGAGSSAHTLVPTIARKKPALTPEQLGRTEKDIANSFAQRSPPFVNFDFNNEWRTLFYMQHYGIPTRLLDWSESPFVGLYFALTSVARNDRGKPITDVALWLCDPVAWNRFSLSHITYAGGVLDEYCEEIKAYSPSADVEQRNMMPIMIHGNHNSPRIVAQRGVFALFGKGTDGMEKIYKEGEYSAGILEKIIIKKGNVDTILQSLYRKGFAESTIYPDLVGLSLEIKRRFGYH